MWQSTNPHLLWLLFLQLVGILSIVVARVWEHNGGGRLVRGLICVSLTAMAVVTFWAFVTGESLGFSFAATLGVMLVGATIDLSRQVAPAF